MKIYSEIAIDMNPESSSYGETLHEDSYEYEGDMMLCGRLEWEDSGWKVTDSSGDVWTSRVFINRWGNIGEQEIFKNGTSQWTNENNMKRAEAETYFNTYLSTYANNNEGVTAASGQVGDFSYTAGEFDPTSEEFRKSVERTGGFGEIAEGYGHKETDFDEFYGAPLDKAKEDYETGMSSLASQTGASLGDIYGQQKQAMVHSGLESSGSIDYAAKKAEKGVFQEYKTQQKDLASGLAFKTDEFWKTTEDLYYADSEEMGDAG